MFLEKRKWMPLPNAAAVDGERAFLATGKPYVVHPATYSFGAAPADFGFASLGIEEDCDIVSAAILAVGAGPSRKQPIAVALHRRIRSMRILGHKFHKPGTHGGTEDLFNCWLIPKRFASGHLVGRV